MRTNYITTCALALLLALGSIVPASAQLTTILTGGNRVGSVTANGGGSFTVVGGGNDIWSQGDEMTYAYAEITGDFDIQVRVESFTPNGRWSKAGLMARESLSEFSRMAFSRVAPADVPTTSGGNGANDVVFMYRSGIQGAGLNGGEHEDRDGANSIPNPAYPNAWIKLVRIGSVFYGSNSVDGVNWQFLSSQDTTTWNGGAFKNTIYLGLAASRHSGGPTATAEFRDLAFAPVSPADFKVIGGTSRGQNNYVYVEFNEKPGAGTTTAGNYALDGGVTVSAVTLDGINPSLVRLTTSALTEGTTYNLTVSGVTADDGGPLTSGTASFVAGAGYESRTIKVTHSHTDNGGLYRDSQAVALGLGDIHPLPLGGGTFPGVQSNTLFEDPLPDQGDNEQFSSRIAGVLNITTTANYKFAMSSDDVGYLYLSTDDQPANKVQIATEPAWNGGRQYVSGGNQGTRGDPAANISAAKTLTAGKKYYLEVVFTEGGGGNNGSATWDGGTGSAFTSGQSPIPAANMAPSREFGGRVFYTLGPVFITQNPSSTSVPAGTAYSFGAACDGTPNYDLQWYKNGVAIPGANGFNHSATAVFPADNGAQIYFVVNGPVNSATSTVATLTVTADLIPPTLTAAWGAFANTNVILSFSEKMNPASANVAANYTINGGVSVLAAFVFDGGSNVVLYTTPQTPGTSYTLTIANITDFGAPALLPISPNPTMVNFTAAAALDCQPGVIEREIFLGLSGGNVLATLLTNPKWPSNPDVLDLINNTIGQSGIGDNYGLRYAGHIIPTVSGNFFFQMHQDDSGRLRGSPDENANNAVTLINIDGSCCGNYVVGPIPLLAGRAYYFDAIMQEGGGGDYLEIRWQPPGTVGYVPIPSANLAYCYDMNISVPPAPQNVRQNTLATFSVGTSTAGAAQAVGKLRYQWERSDDNGATFNPVAGATAQTYTIPIAPLTDNNAQFRAVVSVASNLLTRTSAAAILNVYIDTNGPVLVSASGSAGFTNVTVYFDELVDTNELGTATDPFNYNISEGANAEFPSTVVLNPDGRSVTLTMSMQVENTVYTVTVNGVKDLVGNEIMADSTTTFRSFVLGCGGVLFEAFNINPDPDNLISRLTSSPNYPNNPDKQVRISVMDSRDPAAYPDNNREHYGGRMRGLFIPPTSGNWVFYLASDDSSQLFLNPSGPSASGKVILTEETGCCGQWAGHQSAPLALLANQGYYIEAIYKEGGGGDYVKVAARLQADGAPSDDPSGQLPVSAFAISGSMLGAPAAPPGVGGPIVISQPPANQSVVENTTATFSLVATNPNSLPLCYQWERKGALDAGFTPIPGATTASVTVGPVGLVADNNSEYRCVVSVVGTRTTSSAGLLSVLPDLAPPVLLSADGDASLIRVTVQFNELLDPTTATDRFNYNIADGLPAEYPISVTLNPDGKSVTLVVSPLTENTLYTITVNGVKDRAATPNVVDADSQVQFRTFIFSCGYVLFEAYDTSTVNSSALADLLNHPNYPNNPRDRALIRSLNSREAYPDDSHEQYGARIRGVYVPSVSGNYIFYLKSDDASELRFNPNGSDPLGAVALTAEAGCCGQFSGHASAPQALTAGGRYYIEALYKEGGGGDYVQVAAKLDTDPANPDGLPPIGSGNLGILAPFGAAGTVTITQQPVDTTAAESSTATFTVAATSSLGLTPCYQWERKNVGALVWTPIPGSTATLLVSPVTLPSDQGAQFRVHVSVVGMKVTSDTATLTVTPDTTPPAVVSVGSENGSEVGVCFNERVDATTATDPFNYTVNGGAVSVSSVLLRPDGRSAILTVAGLSSAYGAPLSVCATGILDRAFTPNTAASCGSYFVWGLTPVDIGNPGDPQVLSKTFACENLEVIAGGTDIWDTHDGFHFDYTPKTGNFDVRVRVESLICANIWSKAGLMARENLTPGSRNLNAIVDPAAVPALDGSGNGANAYECNYRDTQDGGPAGWPGGVNSAAPAYPNAWLRMSRVNNVFTAYRSTDGVNWVQSAQTTQTYPATINVGLATTAHSLSFTTTAIYKELFFVPPPAIQSQPASQTVACLPVTFTVGATGVTDLTYQWRLNGADLPGETNASVTVTSVPSPTGNSVDVVVSNSGGATTSSAATLDVTGPPPVVSCPAPISVKSYSASGVAVNFTPTATDLCDPNPIIGCVPASGSIFPVGITTVTCTATNNIGLTNACNFAVTVIGRLTTNFTVGVDVPDASMVGLASTKTISTFIGEITDLNVTLNTSNGWNGDLYAYLTHESGFSVLLNRTGKRLADPLGYGDAGIEVTLDDTAANNDIHVYRFTLLADHGTPLGGPLTGSWAPDGRQTDPALTDIPDARTALLSSFNGLNPNGEWVLYIADVEGGDVATLVSWGLDICGVLPTPVSILTQPTNQIVECPNDLTLTFTTAGTVPQTNQWYRDGSALAGETGTSLVLTNLHPGDSASFSFTVCNMANCVTSAPIVITVRDTTVPSIVCASNILGVTDGDLCYKSNVTFTTTASDTCSSVALVCVPPSGANFTNGVTTVTCTATDNAGNSNVCTFTVTIQDLQGPGITCPSNIVAITDAGQCSRSNVLFAPTIADNCPDATYVCSPPSGSTFPLGTNSVTCVATDPAGNSNACSFSITINDTQLPSIICPADVLTNADPGLCIASTVVIGTATATDNCGVASISSDAPATYPSGTTLVTWMAIDVNGNTNTCTQRVTVYEPIPPAIVCPPDLVIQCNESTHPTNTGFATATDNCPPAPVVSWSDMSTVVVTSNALSGWAFYRSGSPLTATISFVNGAGTPPLGTGSARMVFGANGENLAELRSSSFHLVKLRDLTELGYKTYRTVDGGGGEQAVHLVLNIDTDGNGTADDVICFEARNQDGDNPLLPNQGATQTGVWQTWNALSGGWWSLNNPLVMTRGPGVRTLATYLATFPNARIVNVGSGGGVRLGTGGAAGVWDDFDGNVDRFVIGVSGVSTVYDFELVLRNNLYPCITRTWKATDASSNMAWCAQVICVVDTIAPTIVCSPNIVTNLAADCSTVINYTSTATDACPGLVFSCTPASGSVFAQGVTTVTCFATDAVGNTNGCTFTVTVLSAAPTFVVQPQNRTTPMGNGVSFNPVVTGTATLLYQWQTNEVDVTGATASSLTLSNLPYSMNGTRVRVIASNCIGTNTSAVAILTVTPIIGISFDFNTAGQWTNAPYNLINADWVNTALINQQPFGPTVPFEVSTGGVGVATGGGGLDLTFNNGSDNTSMLLPVTWDFSQPGKMLTASMMVKIKNPLTAGRRAIQMGFLTSTQSTVTAVSGLAAVANDAWISAILQSTVANSPQFQLRAQLKPFAGTTATETIPVNTPTNILTTNMWYKLVAKFVNTKDITPNSFTLTASMQNMGLDGLTPGAVELGLPTLTLTNLDVVNTNKLYLAIRCFEDGGNDYWDNIFVSSTGGPVFFVGQPVSQTVAQGRTASFQALVDGDGPYTYQWNKNGLPIAGAGNWKYTTPPMLLSDSGAQYTVTVTSTNNSITSDPATVTVTSDDLDVVSVGSVDGCVIGLRFDQPVDKATAENPANYLINGQPAAAANLRVNNNVQQGRTNGTEVLLTPASPISGAFTVTVANVASLSGNVVGANNTAAGVVAGLTGYDVDPARETPANTGTAQGQNGTVPGQNYSFAPGQFEVTGGGLDIFGNFDGLRYVYTRKTGDFDIKVRVPYLDALRTPNKGGFNARVSLSAYSPNVGAYANPQLPGRNFIEGGNRPDWNVASASWGNNAGITAGFPNAWVRLRRAGNSFIRYSSTNGVNWQCDGNVSPQPVFPATLFFGLAVDANVGGVVIQQDVTAQFDNYGDFAGYPGAVITFAPTVTNATVAAGSAATFFVPVATVSGGGIPSNGGGELVYVWQRSNGVGGFTNMPTAGATNNTVSSGVVYGPDNGAVYRVVVSAPGAASVTAVVANLTVTDTAAPTIAASFIPSNSVNQIFVNFNEYLSLATASNPANYTVTNSAGVVIPIASVAVLNGDTRSVVITTVNPIPAGTYGVRITGVQDLNGNPIVASTLRTFRQTGVAPIYPVVMDLYGTLANTTSLADLTNNIKFQQDTPDFIQYSNVFGWNIAAAAFPSTLDNYGVRMYSYFVPTQTQQYVFWIRADDFAAFYMNTNVLDSTNRLGRVGGPFIGANNPNYSITNVFITPPLTAGQRYYTELLFKETGGGDGATLMVTTGNSTNTIPAATTVVAGDLFAFPDAVAALPKAVVELYTGYAQSTSAGSGTIADLLTATNSLSFISKQPNIFGYEKYFGYSTNLGNTSLDNYLGRIYSYFVAPSNGLYKFWIRADDAAQLLMNTNALALDNRDPAGMTLLGGQAAFNASYTLAAQNVSLMGGKRYYMEGRWREGGGGDGMTIAVRSQGDAATPGVQELILGNLLEFPTNLLRVGPIRLAAWDVTNGIGPFNPVINEGQSVTFIAQGLNGAPPYLGFTWLKNGVTMFIGAPGTPYYVTPPLLAGDDQSVYTLVVSNLFSVTRATSTVTVIADLTPPTIVSAVASQYGDSVVVTFSEPVSSATAQCLANFSIPGLRVLSIDYDEQYRNRVTLRTVPQTPGTVYNMTVNNVRDTSSVGNMIAANSMKSFTAWGFGGCGAVYVEIWTNIPGGLTEFLTADPRFIDNLPDTSYYTNVFGAGAFAAQSGLDFYGARVSGYFIPPSNGLYRFYIRSDDGSKLFMNTNGSYAPGKVLIARSDAANSGATPNPSQYENGIGLGRAGESISPILSLTNGTAYYMEALLKEGGGGDYVTVVMRAIDPATLLPTVPLPATAVAADILAGTLFSAPGNPDRNQLLVASFPPPTLTVGENDFITLAVVATAVPASLTPYVCYKWEKFDGVNYTNIVGSNQSALTFYAALADNGALYRVTASIPGGMASYTTLLTVTNDITPPYIVSVGSVDGYTIGVCMNERVDNSSSVFTDPFNWDIDGAFPSNIIARPDGRSVILQLYTPVTTTYTVSTYGQSDFASIPNTGDSSASGRVECLTPLEVGVAGTIGIGGFNAAALVPYPINPFSCSNASIDVWGNGWDIWNAADGFHSDYREISGNFDVKTRVQSFTGADQWSKAGLMARASTNSNSRMMYMNVTPATTPIGAQAANNFYSFQYRDADGASAAPSLNSVSSLPPVGYPNAWVRLQRVGNVFNGYFSSNNVDWVLLVSRDTAANSGGAFPNTVFVGLATTSHDQTRGLANNAFAEYRNIYIPKPPTITNQPTPPSQTVPLHSVVSYTVGASNPPNSGPLTYQWLLNGVIIPGATSDTLTIPNAMVSDSGIYTVNAANDGGAVISIPVTLVVNNGLPVVGSDLLCTTSGIPIVVTVSDLLTNDLDPEGDALSLLWVSGVAPVTVTTNFNEGNLIGASLFGVANIKPSGGTGGSGYLEINPAAASQAGAMLMSELTPGKRVSAFSVSMNLRIGDGTAEPADGFSVNFASDLPADGAAPLAAEQGVGTGFSFCIDNYRFVPIAIGAAPGAPGGGTANTSGMKIVYKNVIIAGVQMPTWNRAGFVPVSITVLENGALTVLVDGTNVFGSLTLPGYTPSTGRFGFHGRTGGATESHWIDDLSVSVRTVDTALSCQFTGAGLYGSTYIGGGALHITDALNGQAGGFVVNELTPGAAVTSFASSFLLRIGNGTGNAADGFSFNFAGDLPLSAAGPSGAAEEGFGTGLSVCVDNYPTGGPDSPSVKIKYAGAQIGIVLIPKWGNVNFIPVSINLDADGTLDVVVDGTNVFSNLPTPYTPTVGRFGLYARTGGENETHWVDDLAINVTTAGAPGSYAANFNATYGPGTVTMTNGIITYTPPPNCCGLDSYYYGVTDGQVGGLVVGRVDVKILPTNPTDPVIISCPTNRNIVVNSNCQYALPDLTGELVASDQCCCYVVRQSPAAGSLFGLGGTTVTLTVSNVAGRIVSCQMTVSGVDETAPTLTCSTNRVVECTSPLGATVTYVTTATDACDVPVVVCSPASGTNFPLGLTTVLCSAMDASGNGDTCSFDVFVQDTTGPAIGCSSNLIAQCTGGGSAIVTFNVLVSDNCDTNPSLVCSPASGSTFLLGTTNVTCWAWDVLGNSNTCSFTVTVWDTVAPVVTCPSNVVAECSSPAGTPVSFTATASDVCVGPVGVICTPASGSNFAPGNTTVTCSATDGNGNTNSCSFTVTVRDTTPPSVCNGPGLVYAAGTTNDNYTGPEASSPSQDLSDLLFNVILKPFDQAAADTYLAHSFTNLPAYISEAKLTVKARANCCLPEDDTIVVGFAEEGGTLRPQRWSRTLGNYQADLGLLNVPWSMGLDNEFVLDLARLPNASGPATDLVTVLNSARHLDVYIQDDTEIDYLILEIKTCACRTNIVVEKATNSCGAVVTFPTPVFTDNCDSSVTATCTPASGSLFLVGTTSVQCSATDTNGNRGFCSFNVTVVDPRPANLTIMRSGAFVMITWPVTCTTDVLESTPDLGMLDSASLPPVVWTTVNAPVDTVGNLRKVTLPIGPGNRYFRLRRD